MMNDLKPPMHPFGIPPGHPLATGLVGYWPMWERSGNILTDIVNPNSSLTRLTGYNTPTWTLDRNGPCILYDDVATEYHQVDWAPVTEYPYTLACWLRPDALAANHVAMCLSRKSQYDKYAAIGIHADDKATALIRADSTTYYSKSAAPCIVNQWHHVVGVFAGATNRVVYLDGIAGSVDTTDKNPTGLDRVTLGQTGDVSPEAKFSGKVDMPAVWNRALSDREIQQVYLDRYALLRSPRMGISMWGAQGGGGRKRGTMIGGNMIQAA